MVTAAEVATAVPPVAEAEAGAAVAHLVDLLPRTGLSMTDESPCTTEEHRAIEIAQPLRDKADGAP